MARLVIPHVAIVVSRAHEFSNLHLHKPKLMNQGQPPPCPSEQGFVVGPLTSWRNHSTDVSDREERITTVLILDILPFRGFIYKHSFFPIYQFYCFWNETSFFSIYWIASIEIEKVNDNRKSYHDNNQYYIPRLQKISFLWLFFFLNYSYIKLIMIILSCGKKNMNKSHKEIATLLAIMKPHIAWSTMFEESVGLSFL